MTTRLYLDDVFVITGNEPYGATHELTHMLVLHGATHAPLNVMFEICNDLTADGT